MYFILVTLVTFCLFTFNQLVILFFLLGPITQKQKKRNKKKQGKKQKKKQKKTSKQGKKHKQANKL